MRLLLRIELFVPHRFRGVDFVLREISAGRQLMHVEPALPTVDPLQDPTIPRLRTGDPLIPLAPLPPVPEPDEPAKKAQ